MSASVFLPYFLARSQRFADLAALSDAASDARFASSRASGASGDASFILDRIAITFRSASQDALNSAITSCASSSSFSSWRTSRLLPLGSPLRLWALSFAASFSAYSARFSAAASSSRATSSSFLSDLISFWSAPLDSRTSAALAVMFFTFASSPRDSASFFFRLLHCALLTSSAPTASPSFSRSCFSEGDASAPASPALAALAAMSAVLCSASSVCIASAWSSSSSRAF